MTEQTAIRTPWVGLWHQATGEPLNATYCQYPSAQTAVMVETRPISQVPDSDRCKTCWPTKEDTK